MKNKLPIVIIGLLLVAGLVYWGFFMDKGDSEHKVQLTEVSYEDMPSNVKEYLEANKIIESYKAFNYDGSVYLFSSLGETLNSEDSVSLSNATLKEKELMVGVAQNKADGAGGNTTELYYPMQIVKVGSSDNFVFVDFVGENKKLIKRVSLDNIEKLPESVAVLYFGTKDGDLRREQRIIQKDISPENADVLIEELIKGTENPENTLNVLPKGTKVLGYVYDEEKKIATINLSEQILAAQGSKGEIFAVYSIVDTLCTLPGIESVQILVEGEKVETLAGHIYIMEPLDADWSYSEDNKYK